MSSLNFPVDEALSRRFVALAREGARVHDHIRHPPIEPEPNSDLDRLNRAYPKERASDWAWEFLQAAGDHVGLLASSLSDNPDRAGHIHTAATNTLFRGAMEAAAQALWIVGPDDHQTRLVHHLQLVHDDLREWEKAERHLPPSQRSAPPASDRRTRLLAAAAELVDLAKVTQSFAYIEAVRDSGAYVQRSVDELVHAWRSMAGFAHGKRWASAVHSINVPVTQVDTETWRVLRLPDAEWILEAGQLVISMTDEAERRLRLRARDRYS